MDSLRRPVPRNQFVPAMGVPVELNDPPKLPTVPVSRNLQTSRLGLPAKAVAHLFEGRAGSLLDEGRHRNVRKALGELLFTTRGQTGDWNTAGCQPTRTTI